MSKYLDLLKESEGPKEKEKPKEKEIKPKKKPKPKDKVTITTQVHKQMPIKAHVSTLTEVKEIPYVEEIRIKGPDEFTDEDVKLIIKNLTQDKIWDIKKIIFMQRPLPQISLSTERHLKKELIPLFKRIFSEA
jgi:hypothetical protein